MFLYLKLYAYLYGLNILNAEQYKQVGNWILNIFTYPNNDAGHRNSYHGQANNGEPHGLGVLFYNQNDPEERERYEGQFR